MTQTNIFDQKLLGPTVFIPKALLAYVTRSAAALLQQLHYSLRLSTFSQYGALWVSRTLEDWGEIIGYSPKTVQRGFESLEALGLVISDRFHKHMYNQQKSYRVNYEVLQTYLSEESKRPDLSSQNVHDDVDILGSSLNNKILNTDLKEQQTENLAESPDLSNPTHHPVSKIDKEGIVGDPDNHCKGLTGNSLDESQILETKPKIDKPKKPEKATTTDSPELDPELEQEIVQAVGHKLSAGLKMMVIQASSHVVKDALTVLQTTKNVRNKAGLLRKAIEQEWKPSAAAKPEKKFVLDPDFNEWWGYAKQLGLVIGSEVKGENFWIYAAPNGEPTPYEEIRSMFSMNWLKKRLGKEH